MRSPFYCAMTVVAILALAAGAAAQEPLLRIAGTELAAAPAGARQAAFGLDKIPAGPLFVHLKLKAAGPGGVAGPLEVRLNGKSLFRGTAGLSADYWRFRRYEIKAGVLRTGPNLLEVEGGPSPEVGEACFSDHRFLPTLDLMTDFEVDLPAAPGASPEAARESGFKLRGTKGWAWTPEQYLAEIPYLVKARMNFLMNCYTSLFTSLDPFVNRWWEPLPEAKKKGFEAVVKACRDNGIEFCFAVHPGLFSERPLVPGNARDFEDLWQHYAWMQGLGVKWFSVSYDDIGVEGLDKARLGEDQAGLVNALLARLRAKDPGAQLIFCPVYYMGCGDTPDGRAYFEGLSRVLAPDVYVFWTGDAVVPPRITMDCATVYKQAAGRRLVLWDNYPVNDRHPTLHLGPVVGRPADLPRLVDGYMGNPLCPQNEINRIPLLTEGDYARDPEGYDPLRSIGQAIVRLAETPAQRLALKHLVELYPGNILYGDSRTNFNPVLERFRKLAARSETRRLAAELIGRVEGVEQELGKAFPGMYEGTRATLRGHIAEMKAGLGAGDRPTS